MTMDANRLRITQALHSAVQTRGGTIATIDGVRSRSWAEVANRVARAASCLQRFGALRGDRVAVLSLNSDRYFELLFAVPWMGAAIVPLNTRWAVAEVAEALRDCGAGILAVDDAFLGIAAALAVALPKLSLLYIGNETAPEGYANYDDELLQSEPIADRSGSGDDLWAIFYTGGTTGHPKGVMLSHTNIMFGSLSWIPSMSFSPETKYLHVVGLFHIAGAQPAISLTIAGGTHVFVPKFEPVSAMAAIARYRANYVLFIPTMLSMLLHHSDFGQYDLSSIRHCEYGGAPMPDALLELTLEKLPSWTFIQGYGQTEASGMMTFLPWERHFGEGNANKRRGTGRAAFAIEMRVVNEQGVELTRRIPGEVAVRGPTVMLGYWGNAAATAAVIRNGWLHTGDAGWMDEDGYLFVVDRVKDMIVSGGENVFSKEVENAIHKHPAVRECAVIGIPDLKWGETVHAVIVLKDGVNATADSIISHCRGLIAGYKCPRSIEFRTELPLSAAGKIMKGSLREAHWAGRTRRVN